MDSETHISESESGTGRVATASSPRSKPENVKLPPISGNKSPETNYSRKNKEMIRQIMERKSKQQELMEKTKKKEAEERERLRLLILEEAARVREHKKQKDLEDQAREQSAEMERKEQDRKRAEKARREEEEQEEETEQEKEDKAKLYQFYRSRHVVFLKSLKENIQAKKEREEMEKKKKEDAIIKIRERMGIDNVTSKFYDFDKNKDKQQSIDEERDESTDGQKKRGRSEKERPKSSEPKMLTPEAQKALLERQKKAIADILEKKRITAQLEEEKQKHIQRQREKLKDKILGQIKKGEEYQVEDAEDSSPSVKTYTKSMSANLNGLALESEGTFTKKGKMKKHLLSLPPIKDRHEKEDDEDYKDSDDLEKIPESTKSSKSGKKSKKKLPTYPNITDMVMWKKRHKLDPETKVFIISGGYGDIKAALEKRGWVENPDQNSPCFDFKWTLRAKDIDHGSLLENQIVNHFEKNTSITTKVGLCKNLRNLIWFDNVDIDTFYPKCFDLSDVQDYESFLDEFKCVKAESVLKQYVKACKSNEPQAKEMELRVQVAAKICESRLIDLDELLEDQKEIAPVLVSAEEWEILANDELNEKGLALKKHEAWLAKYATSGPKCSVNQKDNTKKPKTKKKKKKTIKADNKEAAEEDGEDDKEGENELLDRVEAILEECKAKFPQSGINGDKNIWIVKPAGLSRGRGISCFRNLVEIQDYVKGKESQWIAQKYIENPLIVHKRKFDIRQWILVTDWNPLTIWFYEECYFRFSAEEYDDKNLDNKFVHLTNNSIAKYHENQNCPTFEQNMWRMEVFMKYIEETYGQNIFEEKIKPKMKQCVIWALECVQDMVENRKNSHEFYGVDFMIDEEFNVWLIEINSSPDMEYSTPVTKRLVKTVSDDIIKVIVDYNLNPSKKKKKEIDTGLFTQIYKSKRFVEKPTNSFGLDLICEGKKITK